MAKAETIGEPPIRRDGTSASLRDYTSLLGVVAAGILGMSLLCITSAIALSNPDPANPIVLEPASIVDMAIQNLNTVSALTVQAVAVSIDDSTPTPGASALPPSPTLTASAFPTLPRFTSTVTRRPRATVTPTRVPPTNTPRPPTNTPLPSPTRTRTPFPTPVDTNTPTDAPPTPIDTPTDAPPPTPIDTPTDAPPPTPIDTPTDAPPPTPIDTPTDPPTPGI